MSHIWKNENSKECRIGLYHYDGEKDGKTIKVVDNELRDTYKKHKLRWKNILNEANDRILVMGGTRPDGGDHLKNELDELISIKAGLLYSVDSNDPRVILAKNDKSIFFMPSLYLNSLLN